jgi:hypothetical protein
MLKLGVPPTIWWWNGFMQLTNGGSAWGISILSAMIYDQRAADSCNRRKMHLIQKAISSCCF